MSAQAIQLCVDLGGTVIKAGVVQGGRVLAAQKIQARSHEGLRPQLPRLKRLLEDLLKMAGAEKAHCSGLAVAFPTLVDGRSCRLLAPMRDKYADAMEIDVAGWARAELGLPCKIENDSRAALLGEWRFGAGRNCGDLVMVTLGTGIGTGVLLGGRLLYGRHAQAGVLGGHLIVNADGAPCGCGGKGCVEAESASAAVLRMARTAPGFPDSALAREARIDFANVFRCAADGDPVALHVRNQCIQNWAVAVVNLIHAYDPSRVIIGGGVMSSADVILPELRRLVSSRAWTPWGMIELAAASLGDDAALLGLGVLTDGHPPEYL